MTLAPTPVSGVSADAIQAIFGRPKALIGVVHLLPLPGAPRYAGEGVAGIVDRALADARAYLDGGLDGVIVENHGDIPFSKPVDIGPEVAAHMAVVADRIHAGFGKPVGINVLANAPIPALAIASASGAGFIRVNQWANAYVANEGPARRRGGGGDALPREASRQWSPDLRRRPRQARCPRHHGRPRRRGARARPRLLRRADAIIATGQRTGHAADLGYIRTIKAASHLPTLVGSGVTADNVGAILAIVDGVIVASSLKHDGVWWNPVDPQRVRAFVAAAPR